MKVNFTLILFMTIHQHVTFAYSFGKLGVDLSSTINGVIEFLKTNVQGLKDKFGDVFSSDTGESMKTAEDDDSEDSKNAWATKDGGVNYVELVKQKTEDLQQLTTPELAVWHGRIIQSYSVETKDGYIITLHRIANSRVNSRTVLLHHGLLGSSTDWIMLGSQKSLPYILSDAGYDVWMTNARGNYYSRGHISLTVDYTEYWDFSFQEIGEYDLSAVIDHIREKNDNQSINFIGHSMGATALLVLLSTAPQYSDYLRMGILLAPLAFMSHVEGPMKKLTTLSDEIIKAMGDGEFLPSRKVPSWLTKKHCRGPKVFCNNPLLFLSGFPQHRNWNANFIAQLLYHIPAGGSTNTILHYLQLARNARFHKFNDKASEFNLGNITLPLALLSSSDDWLATLTDVLKLYFCVRNPIDHHIIRDRNVSHTDFVWGSEASSLVFNKIVEYLENGLSWNMMKSNEVD